MRFSSLERWPTGLYGKGIKQWVLKHLRWRECSVWSEASERWVSFCDLRAILIGAASARVGTIAWAKPSLVEGTIICFQEERSQSSYLWWSVGAVGHYYDSWMCRYTASAAGVVRMSLAGSMLFSLSYIHIEYKRFRGAIASSFYILPSVSSPTSHLLCVLRLHLLKT